MLLTFMWLNTRTAAIIVGDDYQSHNNEITSNTDNNNFSKVLFDCCHITYRSRNQSYTYMSSEH